MYIYIYIELVFITCFSGEPKSTPRMFRASEHRAHSALGQHHGSTMD